MTLSEYMKAHRLGEDAIAALIGCSSGAVRKWRYGQRMPRRDQLQRITQATAGEVTANDFMPSPATNEATAAA